MSGECDECGFHCLECRCNGKPEREVLSQKTMLRDKCTRLRGLIECLSLVVDHNEFARYIDKPHYDLVLAIKEKIDEVDEGLMQL